MKIFNLLLIIFLFTDCSSGNRDVIVKKDLAVKAGAEIDFIGVRFLVNDGTVTLNGECATETARDAVYKKVKGLYGVSGVINNIRIAEVIIGRDWLLKRSADSILTKYAQVEAITKDSIILLQGKIEKEKEQELILSMRALGPHRLDVQLIN